MDIYIYICYICIYIYIYKKDRTKREAETATTRIHKCETFVGRNRDKSFKDRQVLSRDAVERGLSSYRLTKIPITIILAARNGNSKEWKTCDSETEGKRWKRNRKRRKALGS